MFVSDTPNGLDSDLFSWDGTTPGNSEILPSSVSPAQATRDGAFQPMTMTTSGSKQPRTLAPNLTRRSHKKSRAGCYTCKHRKIKCGEQKPKCANCLLKGLDCIYPTVEPTKRKDPSSTSTSTSISTSTISLTKRHPGSITGSPSTATFSMLDMRFFHHFLTTAYPHLPLGNDHVWVNEIPQFAESHCYLMHALLSLGASHLSRLTGTDYRKESLTHRGHAIAGLNAALSSHSPSSSPSARRHNPHQHTYGESDAMLAACYALTFQASYMGDGLADFITMVRGCALTTAKIKEDNALTAFNLQPNWHYKIMAPRLANLPRVNHVLLESGIAGLEDVRGLMRSEVDVDFHQALVEVLEALRESPQDGYLGFAGLYSVWYELQSAEFKQFLDPANLPAQLLLAYFVALQMLMVPLAVYEWPERADRAKSRVLSGTVEWALNIFKRLDNAAGGMEGQGSARARDLAGGLAWPRRIVGIVRREIGEEWAVDGGGWDEEMLAGVSVLKLGLPISPSMEAEESVGSDGDGMGGGGELPLGWDHGGGGSGGLDRFWDDDPGPGVLMMGDGGIGNVDPVLVTSMGLDAGVAAQVPISMSMAQINHATLQAIDLEMDLL